MSFALVCARAPLALTALPVYIEVHLANGLPGLTLVGLPEKAVKESKDRVRAAILNSGFAFPQKRITISLAPADLPKDGARYDLAIALGILCATGVIAQEALTGLEFHAELSLSGQLRPVRGLLPCALAAKTENHTVVCAPENGVELALAAGRGQTVSDLAHLVAILRGEAPWPPQPTPRAEPTPPYPDFAEVIGQLQVKRALLIAAAGGHHLLMSGPPGTGKSMLAQRFPGILPPMSTEEALESAALASLGRQGFALADWKRRPFRHPHHSSSAAALVGGGSIPQPGEISLAHGGVLFLDELPEFARSVLEMLREPLETGSISISRARMKCEFPARFQLLAAMNPCPCGYLGDPERACTDTPDRIARYRNRLSGPLLDRIDLLVHVGRKTPAQLQQDHSPRQNSAELSAQAQDARARMMARQACANAQLTGQALEEAFQGDEAVFALLQRAATKLQLSMRAYHRLLRVARTIADLEDSEKVQCQHAAEALQYRAWADF